MAYIQRLAIWIPVPAASHPVVVCRRPGERIWIAFERTRKNSIRPRRCRYRQNQVDLIWSGKVRRAEFFQGKGDTIRNLFRHRNTRLIGLVDAVFQRE